MKELAKDPAFASQEIYTLQGKNINNMVKVTLAELAHGPKHQNAQIMFTPCIDDQNRYFCENEDNRITFQLLSPSAEVVSRLSDMLLPYDGVRVHDLLRGQVNGVNEATLPRALHGEGMTVLDILGAEQGDRTRSGQPLPGDLERELKRITTATGHCPIR